MPDRIREDFESAATRPIPPEVLADFENPFPEPPPSVEEHFPGGVVRGETNSLRSPGTPEHGTP